MGTNYSDKDNYSIFDGNDWIGFLSLELQPDCLFIHTLQLIPGVHGRNVGLWVFQWIQDKASGVCRVGSRRLRHLRPRPEPPAAGYCRYRVGKSGGVTQSR
jgi:hypothetical protein